MKPVSKTFGITVVLIFCFTLPVVGRDIFAIKSVSDRDSTSVTAAVSVAVDDILSLSAEDLERRLELDRGLLGGITITSLPGREQGVLLLDGAEVQVYDFIDRQSLSLLYFVPGMEGSTAGIAFLPQCRDAVTASLAIRIVSEPPAKPGIEDVVLETARNTARSGVIAVWGVEEEVTLQTLSRPQKGEVVFDGTTFVYSPYRDMTGSDHFTVCARTGSGIYSREASVTVTITGNSAPAYADMAGNPSAYAALCLREAGVLTGRQVGEAYFLDPEEHLSRGSFLVMLLSAAGLGKHLPPAVNTGLPNDRDIPLWLKPYIQCALEHDILPEGEAFRHNEVPTRAEAVVLIHRASGIRDVQDYGLSLPDRDHIPDYALPSYKALAAYGMLDLYTGSALPHEALTNSYSIDLVWQLYRHMHR